MSNMDSASRVVIVIPSYNEGDRVEQVVRNVLAEGFSRVVVVDDGSSDDSMIPVRIFPVIILQHPINRGAGAATETGLEYCRRYLNFDAVVTIDADTQHDAGDISSMVMEHFRQQADITIGDRLSDGSNVIPRTVRFFNTLANLTTLILSFRKVNDSQSGFKVLSRKAVDLIRLEHDNFEFCTELFVKAEKYHLKVIHVPVRVYYPAELRHKGQNLSSGVRTFVNLLYSTLFKHK